MVLERLVEPLAERRDGAQRVVRLGVSRLDLDGLVERGLGLVEPPVVVERDAEPARDLGVPW